jgi:hypothetical protein
MKRTEFATWYRQDANAWAIENCVSFRKFFLGKNFLFTHTINKDNREDFKRVFDKPDTHWAGSEFYFHVWIRYYGGEKFIILTAKGKGTCIELCDSSYTDIQKKGKVIIRFVEDLYDKLHSLPLIGKGDIV